MSEADALDRIRHVTATYRQPAPVQRWVSGREVTIGILETTSGPVPLAPMEIIDGTGLPPAVYGYDEKEIPGALARLRPVADEPLAADARICKSRRMVVPGPACNDRRGCVHSRSA